MNILFIGHGFAFKMFYTLKDFLSRHLEINKSAFYISHSLFYSQCEQDHPGMDRFSFLKEWEIIREASGLRADPFLIRQYEIRLGDPFLWPALVADRRLYLGSHSMFRQDYSPRFTHEDMLKILQAALVRVESFLDETAPDVILNYAPATFADYLFYLFARNRNITFLNLRSTKIKNHVRVSPGIFGIPPDISEQYQQYQKRDPRIQPDEWMNQALEYVTKGRESKLAYEGAVITKTTGKTDKRNPLGALYSLLKKEMSYRFGQLQYDLQASGGFIIPMIYKRFIKPLKIAWFKKQFSSSLIREQQLKNLEYVFCPLHTEPEVALLVTARPFMNQIETLRLISQSIPVHMKLLVKEHPVCMGKRSMAYYRKLLQIPNLLLVHPDLSTYSILEHAKMTMTISSSVAFESLLKGVPAITMSDRNPCPFSILPDHMIKNVTDPFELARAADDLMKNFSYDKNALIHYVAAVMRGSVPVDYYSALLQRPDSRKTDLPAEEVTRQYDRLAQYLAQYITGLKNRKQTG